MKGDCKTCKYYCDDKKECRRLPPIRLPRKFSATATEANRIRDEELLFGWPKVEPNDWCGEYKY